jgi:hypothetical protein
MSERFPSKNSMTRNSVPSWANIIEGTNMRMSQAGNDSRFSFETAVSDRMIETKEESILIATVLSSRVSVA